jgi:hypothetical protein
MTVVSGNLMTMVLGNLMTMVFGNLMTMVFGNLVTMVHLPPARFHLKGLTHLLRGAGIGPPHSIELAEESVYSCLMWTSFAESANRQLKKSGPETYGWISG